MQNDIDLDQEFSKYEESLGKNDRNFVLFEHLKAIYDAGAQSSRLDADLLVKNTVDKIFTGVDSLKTSISLFLVIGILGTLVGLAISIGGFSGGNFVMSGQNGATADELSLLFNNLRGAFAPSMWGVFLLLSSSLAILGKFKRAVSIKWQKSLPLIQFVTGCLTCILLISKRVNRV